MPIEQFIRRSDNLIKLTLTEDGDPVSGAWDAIDIIIGGILIHREADGDGVSFDTATGLLTISPGDLTPDEQDALDVFCAKTYQRTQIIVTTTLNNDGAVFGGEGCEILFFHISDKPI